MTDLQKKRLFMNGIRAKMHKDRPLAREPAIKIRKTGPWVRVTRGAIRRVRYGHGL